MEYPTLPIRPSSRQMIDAFGGYNHNLRLGDGEFYDMRNMTSDFYPVLSPRGKRGSYGAPVSPQGMISKDSLCYVDGTDFVMGEYHVDLNLSTNAADCPKTMTSMGAYVIIMPDRKWINTMNLAEYGSIDASFVSSADVSFTLCTIDGAEYENFIVGSAEPTEPENMQLWMDTSNEPHVLKKYSASSGIWAPVSTTYIKIHSPNLGRAFSQYDGVEISGVEDSSLQNLNGSHAIWAKGEDYIVVVGILDVAVTQPVDHGVVTIRRQMPDIDFLVESGNRMWGCRYGLDNKGQVVNQIYASKLGDFKNWTCYMGVSTDSYYANCGTDGRFTGAINYLGNPLFFKEHCVHKVFGNLPANFQIQDTPLRGVQRGSERSLAMVNEVLYYKSASGICAYDGSLPVEVSQAFGGEQYDQAVAGSHGNKYYVSMRNVKTDSRALLVYDVQKGMWHKEDDLKAESFCSCKDDLFVISDGKILTMLGSGTAENDNVSWMVTTGEIGLSSPDAKYISRLTLRLQLEIGAELRIFARYDFSQQWESLGRILGTSLRSFSLSFRPKRCDYMVLKLEGIGNAKLYSLTKTIEQGSEIP